MHANYHFLTNIDSFIDATDLADSVDNEICQYSAACCDENNWWRLQSVTLADDRRMDFSEQYALKKTPGAWRDVWLSAYQSLAADLLFWYSCSNASMQTWHERLASPERSCTDIGNEIRQTVPGMLADCYNALAAGRPASSLESYKRANLARRFELFSYSDEEGCAPFSRGEITTPYEYRAFALTPDDDWNAIITVDIHT